MKFDIPLSFGEQIKFIYIKQLSNAGIYDNMAIILVKSVTWNYQTLKAEDLKQ